MNHQKITRLVITALFAALTCVATSIIKLPTVGTNGYVNIGDMVVLLCAWLIGGAYGGLAAGMGSALADLLGGYGSYAPGTFVIKFLMAVVAFALLKGFEKIKLYESVGYILSGIVAELLMVAGYFVYESLFLGYGLAAVASIGSNFVQGATCLVLGVAVIFILEQAKIVKLIKEYV